MEELSDRRYPIDPTAATLSVRNRDGSIRIYGAGGDVREVRVETVKKAYTPERLKAISTQVAAERNSISIDTIYPKDPGSEFADRSGTVDYVIVVPQNIRIAKLELSHGEVLLEEIRSAEAHAKLGIGRFFVHNCFGNLDIGVMTGNLALVYEWWEQQDFTIRSKVEDGNAFAFLPAEAEFHLSARAVTGKISNDFEEIEQRRAESTNQIDMLIGGAERPKIEIEARDGNIRIAEHNP
ncbi:MAG: hypothetical protein JO201_08095 [Verrucomicrobia bacterium]|nr:hypothetical protein [Verrucomicrobiota bacterium]